MFLRRIYLLWFVDLFILIDVFFVFPLRLFAPPPFDKPAPLRQSGLAPGKHLR